MSAGLCSFLSSGSSSKLVELVSLKLMAELLTSLLVAGQGPLLASKATHWFLPWTPTIGFHNLAVCFFEIIKRCFCFTSLSLSLGKGWTLLQRVCLIRSGPSSKIFHLINSNSIQEKPYLYLQKSLPSCYSMELIQETEIQSCLKILSTLKERGLSGSMH